MIMDQLCRENLRKLKTAFSTWTVYTEFNAVDKLLMTFADCIRPCIHPNLLCVTGRINRDVCVFCSTNLKTGRVCVMKGVGGLLPSYRMGQALAGRSVANVCSQSSAVNTYPLRYPVDAGSLRDGEGR